MTQTTAESKPQQLADDACKAEVRAAMADTERRLREHQPPPAAERMDEDPGDMHDLPPAPPPLAPPDSKAYHGLLGEIVRVLAPETEADPVGILGQLIVGFGNAIGRQAHFTIGGDVHHLNLYSIVVGDSSTGGKGMSWGRARSVLAKADPTWADNCITNGIASGEGLIYAVRDAHGKDEGVDDKRLLVVEPEWERVMTVAAKEGNTTGPILRSFFDSGNNRSLKVEKPYRCTNAHLSIIGHATATAIRTKMSSAEITNGGANRILWLCVRRTQSLPFGGDPWPSALDKLAKKDLEYAIRTASKIAQEIGLTQQARDAWPPMYTRLTAPTPGPAGTILARGAPIVRRLAAIYALADDKLDVRLADLEAALALWEYARRSVASIFGSSTGNADADRILHALALKPEGMTRTEISVEVFQRNVGKDRIVVALTLLRDNRWAHAKRKATRGGLVERWFAGPPPTN